MRTDRVNEPCEGGTQPGATIAGTCITTTSGVYVQADDYVAEMAGFDAPSSLLGKTDADMPWRANRDSERRRLIDALCMRTGRVHSTTWSMTTHGWRRYLMDERLINRGDKQFFYYQSLDTTELCTYRHWLQRLDVQNGVLNLGAAFNHATLSRTDIQVARLRYLSYRSADITQRLGITSRRLRRSVAQWNRIRAEAERVQPVAATDYDRTYTGVMVATGLTEFILEQEDWFTSGC